MFMQSRFSFPEINNYLVQMNCRAPASVSLSTRRNHTAFLALREIISQRIGGFGTKLSSGGSSLGGSRVIIQLNLQRTLSQRKSSRVHACCNYFLTNSILCDKISLVLNVYDKVILNVCLIKFSLYLRFIVSSIPPFFWLLLFIWREIV